MPSTASIESSPDKVMHRMGRQPQGVLQCALTASTAGVWQTSSIVTARDPAGCRRQ